MSARQSQNHVPVMPGAGRVGGGPGRFSRVWPTAACGPVPPTLPDQWLGLDGAPSLTVDLADLACGVQGGHRSPQRPEYASAIWPFMRTASAPPSGIPPSALWSLVWGPTFQIPLEPLLRGTSRQEGPLRKRPASLPGPNWDVELPYLPDEDTPGEGHSASQCWAWETSTTHFGLGSWGQTATPHPDCTLALPSLHPAPRPSSGGHTRGPEKGCCCCRPFQQFGDPGHPREAAWRQEAHAR